MKAARANDYSRGGESLPVHFKFRKWKRALIKGKADAQGFDALTHAQVVQGIGGYGTQEEQETARNYANRDGEHQTIGTVPGRFLEWPEQAPAFDSDSDSATTEDEG